MDFVQWLVAVNSMITPDLSLQALGTAIALSSSDYGLIETLPGALEGASVRTDADQLRPPLEPSSGESDQYSTLKYLFLVELRKD